MMADVRQIKKRTILLLAMGGLVIAYHLSHWILPMTASLSVVDAGPGWISTQEPSPRGYFRYTFFVPFQPMHAWLSIAADDYTIYVNGKQIGNNIHIVNSSLAFQNKMTERSQSLTINRVIEMKRSPELSKSANEEWRIAHFFDITPYLMAGQNRLAVYVQSNRINRLVIRGSVQGESEEMEIPGYADAWKANTVSNSINGFEWYDPLFDESSWSPAQRLGRVEKTLFSTAPPEIWTRPFRPQPIIGTLLTEGIGFKTSLPAISALAGSRSAWIRVNSNWPYAVFINDEIIGIGEGNLRVQAFDLSRYLGWDSKQLSIFLQYPEEPIDHLPTLAVDGHVQNHWISTGQGWFTLTQHHSDWLLGKGIWVAVQEVSKTHLPATVGLQTRKDLDLYWFRGFVILWMWVTAVLGLIAWGIQIVSRKIGRIENDLAERIPYWILTPSLVALAAQEFMRFRFHESDNVIIFLDPAFKMIWLGTGPLVFFLTLWVFFTRKKGTMSLAQVWDRIPWLFLIATIAWALRAYNLGFHDLQADENVSWDAARGILKGGLPEAVSGIYYTRSPLYHYLLALWLWIFGDQLVTARYFSVVAGIAVIFAVYYLVYAISQKRYLGLIAALIMALDPWQIYFSRIIRFYQMVQVFSIISMLYFLRGFVLKQGKIYQHSFFIFLTVAILSQEVSVTLIPAFFMGFLVFYRPFDWVKDRHILVGFLIVITITLGDMAIFAIRCLTQHVGIATSSGSILQLHLSDIGIFWTTFLVGNNRAHMFYSLFSLAGLVYWLKHPQPVVLMLYGTVLLTLATLTVLVMQVAGRYGYTVYPFLIITAVLTADAFIQTVAARLFSTEGDSMIFLKRRWVAMMVVILTVTAVSNIEFGKLTKSYNRLMSLQHQSTLEHVKRQMKPTDKIMSVHPMPAAIILGGIDYYLMEALSFDELWESNIGLIDRWAGGRLVSKTDHLRALFHAHERVWIILDEPETLKLSQEVVDFINRSCQVQFEFFGGKVYLWDKKVGLLGSAPDRWGEADRY